MYSRQADFIHGVAVIDESFSGIDHWWIGLTDLGMYQEYVCNKPRLILHENHYIIDTHTIIIVFNGT
jgi:hypothetical protein